MKKIILVLITVFALSSCTQQKIGFVNTEKLIKEYKGTVALEAEMKVKADKIQQELPAIISAFQAKVTAYQKKANGMSPANRQAKEQALGAEQQNIQSIQNQIQSEGQAAMVKIAEETNDFIKDYGKKNGYSMIMGTVDLNGAVMYGDEKTDLTETILKALNTSFGSDEKTAETKVEVPVKKEDIKK